MPIIRCDREIGRLACEAAIFKVELAARNPPKPLKPLFLSSAGGDTKGFEGFFWGRLKSVSSHSAAICHFTALLDFAQRTIRKPLTRTSAWRSIQRPSMRGFIEVPCSLAISRTASSKRPASLALCQRRNNTPSRQLGNGEPLSAIDGMRRHEKRREFLALWVKPFGDGDALCQIGDIGDLFRQVGKQAILANRSRKRFSGAAQAQSSSLVTASECCDGTRPRQLRPEGSKRARKLLCKHIDIRVGTAADADAAVLRRARRLAEEHIAPD